MIKIYTIGFAGKSAEKFFALLQQAGVRQIVDTRLHADTQLSGFAKKGDLKFFAQTLANIDYEHRLDFAPSKDLLDKIRKKEISWQQYEQGYLKVLKDRGINRNKELSIVHQCCLLCSEHDPQYCHRRLLAEFLASDRTDVEIIHLM